MIYFHPASPLHTSMHGLWDDSFGIINTPNISVGRDKIVGRWCLDNACFTKWDAYKFMKSLDYHWGIPECQFVVTPDVVCDATATLKRFYIWQPVIVSYGYPVAFVAQNGLTLSAVPFSMFDCLFIGGDNPFKLGEFVQSLVKEAKSRGKWVHMGRVNSLSRLRYAASIGCDSVDGTKIVFDKQYIKRYPSYLENKQERLWE